MVARLMVAAGFLALLTGCSDADRGRAARRPTDLPNNTPPVIDRDQLAYDAERRTIYLYDLIADPATGRKGTWVVVLTEQTIAYPTGPTFQVPPDVAESQVVIRAAAPPRPASLGVRLADVPRK